MKGGENLKTEVLCALIAAGGAILSAVIAWFVSRSTASKELEKMQLTWEREDVVSSEDEFAAMASAVTRYIKCVTSHQQREALCVVASVRAKESGELGELMDLLYATIDKYPASEVEKALNRVIQKKRDTKRKANPSN